MWSCEETACGAQKSAWPEGEVRGQVGDEKEAKERERSGLDLKGPRVPQVTVRFHISGVICMKG